jgi:hypothetical protein
MNIALLALVIDITAIALLAAVIVYAIRLNKYFNLLRSSKEELARQLAMFADSTRRAEDAIEKMKASTEENASLMDQQIRRAELVRRDLSRSSGGSDSRADSGGGRDRGGRDGARPSATRPSSGGGRARRGVPEEEGHTASAARERVMSRRRRAESDSEKDGGDSGEDSGNRQRSKSKSELLKALQGMR